MPRPRQPHLRDADLRELILDTTDALLARSGYAKLTMEELAGQVGIAKATIYLYFANKEDVVLSMITRVVHRVMARLQSIAASRGRAAARLETMLSARVLARFDSFLHYQGSLHDMLAEIRAALQQRRLAHSHEEAAIFAGVLREGARDGSLRRCDANRTAATLLTATESLMPSNLSISELGSRRDVEVRAKRLAHLLVVGLATNRSVARRQK